MVFATVFTACVFIDAIDQARAEPATPESFSPVAREDFRLDDPHVGPRPMLDFSYAGYALVPESEFPNEDLPVIDVADFGAIPDDGKGDREAIAAALAAAEDRGGAVVRFASGVYEVNPEPGLDHGLVITGAHVVLRGVREGEGEPTVLFMEHHLEPTDPNKMWSTPSLFTFRLSPEMNKRPKLARVVSDSRRGGFEVTIDNPSRLEVGQFVSLEMQNPAANEGLLAGLDTWDIWESTNTKGIQVRGERHRIVAIEGNLLKFAEPIHTDITAEHGWDVVACPMQPGWVVEDLTFRGDCPEPFVHHKNAMHDGGWSMLSIGRGYAPVVRRCRFIDVSCGLSFGACYAATAIDLVFEGRQGHTTAGAGGGSYGTLIAFCEDRIELGGFHGFAANQGAAGTVMYRCRNSNRGFDWHASGPYATLIDACTGGLVGNGGNYKNLPNHLQDLVFWNFRQTSGPAYRKMEWWESRRDDERYSGPKVVLPILVGYHGIRSTFEPSQCLLIESHGRPVQPESLFETQLIRRLGELPGWIQRRLDPSHQHAARP